MTQCLTSDCLKHESKKRCVHASMGLADHLNIDIKRAMEQQPIREKLLALEMKILSEKIRTVQGSDQHFYENAAVEAIQNYQDNFLPKNVVVFGFWERSGRGGA